MYAHAQPMEAVPSHYSDPVDAGAGGAESIGSSQICYDMHSLDDASGVGGLEDVKVSVPHDAVYGEAVAQSDQLTLSFRGEVYVFDHVTTEKVQSVLLLLTGYQFTSSPKVVDAASQSQMSAVDYKMWCSDPKRAQSLNRFRQKRKERCYEKKIRYSVRHEVALRMHRKKGQFAPKNSEESNLSDVAEKTMLDDNQSETVCKHCGTSSKGTPMMRRGPAGPRSLCNACGLVWANKGILRDLSRRFHYDAMTVEDEGDCALEYGTSPSHGRSDADPVCLPAGEALALTAEQ